MDLMRFEFLEMNHIINEMKQKIGSMDIEQLLETIDNLDKLLEYIGEKYNTSHNKYISKLIILLYLDVVELLANKDNNFMVNYNDLLDQLSKEVGYENFECLLKGIKMNK